MPTVPSCIIEPIFEQFTDLLPDREMTHPLGCHNPRIPERVVFEKLVAVLVFGCAYWRISEEGCSATTLRDRRRHDEWIDVGAMDALEGIVREAYDRIVGAIVIVIVGGLIREAWTRYRWEGRPHRRP